MREKCEPACGSNKKREGRKRGLPVFPSLRRRTFLILRLPDTHCVKRTVHEHKRYREKRGGQSVRQQAPGLRCKFDCEFDGEQSKQRGELDNRIQRHRRSVLER